MIGSECSATIEGQQLVGDDKRQSNEKLRRVRELRGWSQRYVAGQIGTTEHVVSRWESGQHKPNRYFQTELCKLFGKNAEELGFMLAQEQEETASHLNASQFPLSEQFLIQPSLNDMPLALSHDTIIRNASGELERHDLDKLRRDLIKLAIQAPFLSSLAGGNHLSLSVEEHLVHCDILVQDCWKLMGGKFLAEAEHILSAQVNPLMQIVYSTSRFRREAAAIATKAKIVQAILAMHRLDFAARELYCMEAITCARISQNSRLLPIALMYLAYTYVYHSIPHQPDCAVLLFQEALQRLDGEELLLRGALHSGLAAALAQCHREKEALGSLAEAQTWFPSSPEHDPSFGLIDCGRAEFSLRIGKVFLDLAQYTPQQGYYKQAKQAFEQSVALQAMADRSTSEILIGRGAAALGLGELELYETSLRDGLVLAREVGSQKRLVEAYAIFQDTPHSWQTDKRIQDLEEEFFSPAQLPKRGT